MKQINRNSSVPLYMQLKASLKGHIENHMKPGDTIPIESEIEKQYGVSRMTVRRAVDELVDEGIVIKQQGRGTFVQQPKITQDVGRIFSWTEEMRNKGKTTETKDLEIKKVMPSRKLTISLRLDKDEQVVCVKRIRFTEGEPLAIMMNYLRLKYVPDLLGDGLQSESLYEDLERIYHITLVEADEIISAREATDLEALALQIPSGSAVLHIMRTSYLANGTPIEVVDMTARADRFQYFTKLYGREKSRSL